jgi:non-specific serine/threonine protein kinase
MLETIHEYAHEKLDESGESDLVHTVHLEYFVKLAAEAREGLRRAHRSAWFERVEGEQDNFRAALSWSLARHDPEQPLRLALGIWFFWIVRGQLAEGERWLNDALLCAPTAESVDRAEALAVAGEFRKAQGDLDGAVRLHRESLAMERELGEARMIATSLRDLGDLATAQRRFDEARAYLEEALVLHEEHGEPWEITHALLGLADLELAEARYERAYELAERALDAARSAANEEHEIIALGLLGERARRTGDHPASAGYLCEGLSLCAAARDVLSIAEFLDSLAALAGSNGKPLRAATLWGAAEGIREETGGAVRDVDEYKRSMETARALADAARFRGAWEQGREMSWAQAVAYAVEDAGTA